MMFSEIVLEKPRWLKEPYAWIKHIPFAFFLIDKIKPRMLVELGVHTGNSFCAFLQAVKGTGLETRCFGIDTWLGDTLAGLYDEKAFKDLSAYVDEQYPESSELLKMTFDEALDHFEDKSIDILHIDGLHTYEAVKNDFETWLPKLSEKGVILLHDTIFKEGDFGVWKFWEEISQTYDAINFEYGYGLGLVIVGKNVDLSFKEIVSEIKSNFKIYQTLFERLGDVIFHDATSEKAITKLYADFGQGYSEELSIFSDSGLEAGYINITWDLNALYNTMESKDGESVLKGIRWDPIEKWCEIKLNSITYTDNKGKESSVDINTITSNGSVGKDGWIVFETFDPMFFLPVIGKPSTLKIRGKLEMFTDPDIDERFREIKREIKLKTEHLNQVESELEDIKDSRMWKLRGLFNKLSFKKTR